MRHDELRTTWQPGQQWETRIDECAADPEAWVPVANGGRSEPAWDERQEYRQRPEAGAQPFDALPPEMEGRMAVWLTLGKELNPHTVNLVVRFARALASKLADAEKKYGYSDGWRDSDWMDECRARLSEHVAKGDPRDVAAYCAFLWHHGERTAKEQDHAVR